MLLIGFAGFGSAGKTTAIKYLEQQGFGQRVYLGEAVFEEIARRGLERTPAAERAVRVELRSDLGPSAFADLKAPQIAELISKGECVLVDAIFNVEEYTKLRNCGQSKSVLIAIDASFETRSRRLIARTDRECTADELRKRDETEMYVLGTPSVMKVADFIVPNERSLSDFYNDLSALWSRISSQ
jgi:dephospho-CoA kinase